MHTHAMYLFVCHLLHHLPMSCSIHMFNCLLQVSNVLIAYTVSMVYSQSHIQ